MHAGVSDRHWRPSPQTERDPEHSQIGEGRRHQRRSLLHVPWIARPATAWTNRVAEAGARLAALKQARPCPYLAQRLAEVESAQCARGWEQGQKID
jgi:hypothetical protein